MKKHIDEEPYEKKQTSIRLRIGIRKRLGQASLDYDLTQQDIINNALEAELDRLATGEQSESLTPCHVTSATVIDGYDAAMPVGIAPGDFPIVRQLRDLLNSEQRAMAIDIIAAMHKRLDDNALGEQRTGTEGRET